MCLFLYWKEQNKHKEYQGVITIELKNRRKKHGTTKIRSKKRKKIYKPNRLFKGRGRNLAAELEIDLKDTSRLTGKECRKVLDNLNRIKFNREKGLLRRAIAYLF